jgi:hypothetical protein
VTPKNPSGCWRSRFDPQGVARTADFRYFHYIETEVPFEINFAGAVNNRAASEVTRSRSGSCQTDRVAGRVFGVFFYGIMHLAKQPVANETARHAI